MVNKIDFLAHLPPDRRERLRRQIDAERGETARLYGLSDRWLGEAVLALARKVRAEIPKYGAPNPYGSYNDHLVWQVIPELARRVGCQTQPNEATDPNLRRATG
jgi:hypothetical protein